MHTLGICSLVPDASSGKIHSHYSECREASRTKWTAKWAQARAAYALARRTCGDRTDEEMLRCVGPAKREADRANTNRKPRPERRPDERDQLRIHLAHGPATSPSSVYPKTDRFRHTRAFLRYSSLNNRPCVGPPLCTLVSGFRVYNVHAFRPIAPSDTGLSASGTHSGKAALSGDTRALGRAKDGDPGRSTPAES